MNLRTHKSFFWIGSEMYMEFEGRFTFLPYVCEWKFLNKLKNNNAWTTDHQEKAVGKSHSINNN